MKVSNVKWSDFGGYKCYYADINGVRRIVSPCCSVDSHIDCNASRVCDICGHVCTHRPKGNGESYHCHVCTAPKGQYVCTDCLCAIMKQEGTKWEGLA